MFWVNILIYHVADLLKFVHVLTERSGHSGSDYGSLDGWGAGAFCFVSRTLSFGGCICLAHKGGCGRSLVELSDLVTFHTIENTSFCVARVM